MIRIVFAALPLLAIGCSGSNFDVADPNAETGDPSSDSATTDSTPSSDTDVIGSDTSTGDETPPGIDAGPDTRDVGPPADASCPSVGPAGTDVYVNAGALPGGKGSMACPFRTIAEASSVPLSMTTDRVVHVQSGTYNEVAGIHIRPRETYRAEAGVAKIVMAGSAALCPPSSVNCAVLMDVSSTIDGFLIDGGSVSTGIVTNGTGSGERPTIRNTTVKNMLRDGILVYGIGAKIGPTSGATDNGHSGVVVRNGNLSIDGGPNSFDRNRGGIMVGGTFVPGSGIHMYAGTLFVDNVASANGNYNGVTFDAAGFSGAQQILSQIDIMGNRNHGVYVGKDWAKLQVRKVNIGKNALAGMYLVFNATASNDFDLGTNPATAPGNNIFGTSTTKNGKAGLYLCQSGGSASFKAEKNTWTSCSPTLMPLSNCETMPSYVDVAYVPGLTAVGANPLAPPMSCTAM